VIGSHTPFDIRAELRDPCVNEQGTPSKSVTLQTFSKAASVRLERFTSCCWWHLCGGHTWGLRRAHVGLSNDRIRLGCGTRYHWDFRPCPGSAVARSGAGAYPVWTAADISYWVPGRRLWTQASTPVPPSGSIGVRNFFVSVALSSCTRSDAECKRTPSSVISDSGAVQLIGGGCYWYVLWRCYCAASWC
jgi:hypothetical protein